MTYWNPDRPLRRRAVHRRAGRGGRRGLHPARPARPGVGDLARARREARPRHGLRRRAEQQGRAAGEDHRGGQRLRLRRLADGRHRHPGVRGRAGAGAGAAAPGPPLDLPVCVGLGVSNAEQAAEVAEFADGVIVGSAFVKRLLDAPDDVDAGSRPYGRWRASSPTGVRRRRTAGPSVRQRFSAVRSDSERRGGTGRGVTAARPAARSVERNEPGARTRPGVPVVGSRCDEPEQRRRSAGAAYRHGTDA